MKERAACFFKTALLGGFPSKVSIHEIRRLPCRVEAFFAYMRLRKGVKGTKESMAG